MSQIRVFALLLLTHVSIAQGISSKLDKDPVFSAILSRRINYPVNAERSGVYARVYAGFHIDQKGHIQDVRVLNPAKIGYGFEEEIIRKIKLLPPLNPAYEGSYALPVTFAFIDYTNGAKAISPPGKLSDLYLMNRVLLSELKIVGGKTPYQKGKVSPQSRGQVMTVDQ